MKVALATCSALPEPDADEKLLIGALDELGVTVRLLVWDGDANAPAPGELVVLRSTWNYHHDVDRFLAWVEGTAQRARLFNQAPIVRDNARKTYLRDLEQRGIPIVPTEWVPRGERRAIEGIVRPRDWSAIVIKPVVSAGSYLTRRFESSEWADAQRFLDELTAQRDAMIQKWMPAVETYGERSLVWIDGTLTHAIRKSPRFAADTENVSGEMPITAGERAFADRVMAAGTAGADVLYARVDVIDDGGVLRLMELELIEPSLFLRQCRPALDRFAQAIARHARTQ